MVYKKKSYLGLFLWTIGFMAACTACIFLPKMDSKYLITIFDNIMTISIFILMLMVYFSERVYWINGVTYEDAMKADPFTRKRFALKYVIRFGVFAAAFLLYSVVSIIIGIPFGVDLAVVCVGLVAVALSTINIRL